MHYSNCNSQPVQRHTVCLVDRFVITRLGNSASRHIILPVRRKLPRIEAHVATLIRARVRACSARLHTRCTAVAFGRHSLAAAVPPVAIHFHYVRARALVLARAHAFNYIFASQLPRERKTGRRYRGWVGIPPRRSEEEEEERYAHGRSTWEVVARTWRRVQSRQEESGDCARSDFIAWKSVRSNGRSVLNGNCSRFSFFFSSNT